jgi:hypothetical protein
MRRRLPHEPKQLVQAVTSWIEWRYANATATATERVVLTSAPTSLPSEILRALPGAVWRLAWLRTGSAILYGLAPGNEPRRYVIVEYDGDKARRDGVFEERDGMWTGVAGDNLEPIARRRMSLRGHRHRWSRRISRVGARCGGGA